MLKLYNRERSGNCYKVRLMLSLLALGYEKCWCIARAKAGTIYRSISDN